MALQSVHSQKVKKMPNPALRNYSKNTEVQSFYVVLLPLELKDEL
jgi:hypothetical protein